MFNQKHFLSFAVLSVLTMFAGQANALSCPSDTRRIEVQGEIKNNAISPGISLGIANVRLEDRRNLRCGIMGNGGIGPDATTIGFIHNLVCDDSVLVTDAQTGKTDTIHSQLTLNTSGTAALQACIPNVPQAGFYGSLREMSIPVSGRGIFQGVTKGAIVVEGTINCQGAIAMKLRGEICLRTSETPAERD
jgi:hypothetical protein